MTWNTSRSWNPGAFLRFWWRSMSGLRKRQLVSQISYCPCWSWSPRRGPLPLIVSGTLGSTPKPQPSTAAEITRWPSAPPLQAFPSSLFRVKLFLQGFLGCFLVFVESNMFIWVCLFDPVEIPPQPLGILGEFGLDWSLPKTNGLKCETASHPCTLVFPLGHPLNYKHPFKKSYEDVWAHPFIHWL